MSFINFIAMIFESSAANALIMANIASFIFFKSIQGRAYLDFFILYPGNLWKGYIWSLITSGFIHVNGSHLLWNMLGIFIFARIVQRRLGAAKTLFIYFGSLIISMLVSTIIYVLFLHKNIAIIGASGAVMGLISAAMLLAPFCITYEMVLPIPVMFKAWMFFYADLRGFGNHENDGVSHLAHLCGFLSIACLVYFLSKQDKKKIQRGFIMNIVLFVLLCYLKYRFFS